MQGVYTLPCILRLRAPHAGACMWVCDPTFGKFHLEPRQWMRMSGSLGKVEIKIRNCRDSVINKWLLQGVRLGLFGSCWLWRQVVLTRDTTALIPCIKWNITHTLSHRADNVAQPCFALSQRSCQPTVLHEFKAFCLETHDSACSRLSSV